MNISKTQAPNRRTVLRGALYTAASIPLGVTLASCATSGGGRGDESEAPSGEVSDTNPFGLASDAKVDAVIFKGGYGIDYVEFAAGILEENHDGVEVKVSPSTQIAQELQPRFVGKTPPDLVDNSGAGAIGVSSILGQLEDLTDVIDAPNLEGTTIRDTLFDGVLTTGTYGDKLAAINYVLTVYGVWYSASLFEKHGWTPPTTWAETKELGKAAKEKGLYLFTWGTEAATYYETLALHSAVKEAGDELRLALENLEPDAWRHDAVQGVFTALKEIVDAGYFKPGGAGTQFTQAQAQWSNNQEVILYPSGSWIENEMKDQTAEGFEMKGFAVMSLTDSPALGVNALHSASGEPFIVPSDGNVAAGKELLRTMLSKEAAENFAKTKLAPTVVKDTVPADGFGSTALVSQSELLAAADGAVFHLEFRTTYGLNPEHLSIWNSFLAGKKSVKDLTNELQATSDRVREDDTIEKIEVS